MKDASLFQLGIGPETSAQEEDTARGLTPANDDIILTRDVLDGGRDNHFIPHGDSRICGYPPDHRGYERSRP